MKSNEKKVQLSFIPEEEINFICRLDDPSTREEPIAYRLRSRKESSPKSPQVTSSPSTRFSVRLTARRKLITDSPVTSPQSKDLKVVLPNLDETKSERKVTPLKINTKLLQRTPSPSNDSSVAQDPTPRSLRKRLQFDDDDIFRSPRKRNIHQKENTPLPNGLRTPKTPRLASRTVNTPITPKTPASSRKLFLEKTAISDTPYSMRTRIKKEIHNRIKPGEKYALDSDKYFEKKSAKNVTSNHALSTLATPTISESEVEDVVSKNYVKHRCEVENLLEKYESQFDKWIFYLKEGFNLLMYGVGSKLEILKSFQKKKLSGNYVITIDGFFPGFSIIDLFRALMNDVLEASHCPGNVHDALVAAEEKLKQEENDFPIFIIINNIDGVALKGKQTILSKVAALPNIHIIATVDHINAPLLWGNNKMSAFNFLWLDVTTFSSYTVETNFENSLKIGDFTSNAAMISLKKVFELANAKSKLIFKIILKHYVDNKKDKDYKGILQQDLLRLAKKEFAVSSRQTLNTLLREFFHHKIITHKHNYVRMLINKTVLFTFYKEHCCNDED